MAKGFRLKKGTRVGNYRIQQLLGRGQEGVVYEAREIPTGARRAMKLLHQSEFSSVRDMTHVARFFERLSRTGAVAHYYHMGRDFVGDDEGVFFLVFELLKGELLQEVLVYRVRDEDFDERQRLLLLQTVTQRLALIHRLQVAVGDFYAGHNFMMVRGRGPVLFDASPGTADQPNRDYRNDLDELHYLAEKIFLHRKRGYIWKEVRRLLRRYLRRKSRANNMRHLCDDLGELFLDSIA